VTAGGTIIAEAAQTAAVADRENLFLIGVHGDAVA